MLSTYLDTFLGKVQKSPKRENLFSPRLRRLIPTMKARKLMIQFGRADEESTERIIESLRNNFLASLTQ